MISRPSWPSVLCTLEKWRKKLKISNSLNRLFRQKLTPIATLKRENLNRDVYQFTSILTFFFCQGFLWTSLYTTCLARQPSVDDGQKNLQVIRITLITFSRRSIECRAEGLLSSHPTTQLSLTHSLAEHSTRTAVAIHYVSAEYYNVMIGSWSDSVTSRTWVTKWDPVKPAINKTKLMKCVQTWNRRNPITGRRAWI